MCETFLNYLQGERRRLDQQLERASLSGADAREIARLEQLRRIVDDQLERWSRDLSDRVAAYIPHRYRVCCRSWQLAGHRLQGR